MVVISGARQRLLINDQNSRYLVYVKSLTEKPYPMTRCQ